MHLCHFKVYRLWQAVPVRVGRRCDGRENCVGGRLRRGRQREGDRQRRGSRSKGMVNRSSPAEGLCGLIGSDSSEQREGRFIYNLQYCSCDIFSLHVIKRSPPPKTAPLLCFWWESMSGFYVADVACKCMYSLCAHLGLISPDPERLQPPERAGFWSSFPRFIVYYPEGGEKKKTQQETSVISFRSLRE